MLYGTDSQNSVCGAQKVEIVKDETGNVPTYCTVTVVDGKYTLTVETDDPIDQGEHTVTLKYTLIDYPGVIKEMTIPVNVC